MYATNNEPLSNKGIFAVSKALAKAKKSNKITLTEYKTFILALTKIKFTDDFCGVVQLDKQELKSFLGLSSDKNHESTNLRRSIKYLPIHSGVEFDLSDRKDLGVTGVLVTDCVVTDDVYIYFNQKYLKLISNLMRGCYVTMWAADIKELTNIKSVFFYEFLRLHSDTRKQNSICLSMDQIKEIVGIEKKKYYKKVKDDYKPSYSAFEEYLLEPMCSDLSKSSVMHLDDSEGKLYEKIKTTKSKGGYVYKFFWSFSAQNVKKTTIYNGKKNNKTSYSQKKKNGFNNFSQREMSDEEILELEKSFFLNALANVKPDTD